MQPTTRSARRRIRPGDPALSVLASRAGVHTTTTPYKLDKANEALDDLRSGLLEGAAVIVA